MKKSKIILLVLIPFLCLYFAAISFAHDTDIYAARGQGVEPNILIIFDNSLSMGTLDGRIIPCEPIATKIYEKICPAHAGMLLE